MKILMSIRAYGFIIHNASILHKCVSKTHFAIDRIFNSSRALEMLERYLKDDELRVETDNTVNKL